MSSSKRTAVMTPGDVKAHCKLIEPKVSMQIDYKRGTSMMWLSPGDAKKLGNRLLNAADMCIRFNKPE